MPVVDLAFTLFWLALFVAVAGSLIWSCYLIFAKGRHPAYLLAIWFPITWVIIYYVAVTPAKPNSHWYLDHYDDAKK